MNFTIYNLKPEFQKLLKPLIPYLLDKGATPTKIALITLAGSLFFGLMTPTFAAVHIVFLILFPVWAFARITLNALESLIAYECGIESPERIILGELYDVVADLAMYFPLIILTPQALPAIFFFAIGAVITEFCGLLGPLLGAKRRYDGPMGKDDRILYVCLLTLMSVFVPKLVLYWNLMFLPGIILIVLTCRNRMAGAVDEIKPPEKTGDTSSTD